MIDFIFSPIPGIIAAVIVFGIIGLLYAKSVYKNAAPNEAILVTGRKKKTSTVDGEKREKLGSKIVIGQGVFITPFFEKAHRLSLSSRAIEVKALAQDSQGVTLTVEAVAIVKVGGSDEMIRAAAERFLNEDGNIDKFTEEVLSGSLRSSIGSTTVLTIIKERDKLGETVLNTARESLRNQGLDVDSFEIKGITDENDYIADLGRAEQAEVRKRAEIAESDNARQAKEAQIAAAEAVAIAENKLERKRAELQLDTDKAAAEAAAAKPLAEAQAQQAVVDAQEVTARRKAELRKAQLTSEVNAEADAAAYKSRAEADAASYKVSKDSEAAAAATIAAANADRDSRIAAAAATAAEGQAQADAIAAIGAAEAEATRLSAEAVAKESESLLQLRMIDKLPEIARELAAPMSNIDKLTVISTDGASQLTKNVAGGFAQIDDVLQSTVGFDIKSLLGSVIGGNLAGNAAANAVAKQAE